MDFRITLTGTDTLLMHNSRLSNPLDPAAKAIKKVTSKRNKTDDDHEEVAHLEFIGSLYADPDAGPYVPADNIWRCLYDAAKKRKLGPRVKEGVLIATNVNPLAYRGPRDAEALWADENFRHFASAKVGQVRVTRCRPQFRQWKTEADGVLDTNVMDLAELQQVAEIAGQLIGLGDWRPRYGRFKAVVEPLSDSGAREYRSPVSKPKPALAQINEHMTGRDTTAIPASGGHRPGGPAKI